MAKTVLTYVRETEKVHSVRYKESVLPGDQPVLGTIYVHRTSGLTKAPRLVVTIETQE